VTSDEIRIIARQEARRLVRKRPSLETWREDLEQDACVAVLEGLTFSYVENPGGYARLRAVTAVHRASHQYMNDILHKTRHESGTWRQMRLEPIVLEGDDGEEYQHLALTTHNPDIRTLENRQAIQQFEAYIVKTYKRVNAGKRYVNVLRERLYGGGYGEEVGKRYVKKIYAKLNTSAARFSEEIKKEESAYVE
jgi:hypothetical protein